MQNNHSNPIPPDQNRFWIFNASWSSSSAVALISLAPITLLLFVLAAAAEKTHREVSAVILAIALCLTLLVLALARQMFGNTAYLVFDRYGIDGKAVRGKPIAWGDITSFSLRKHKLRIELQSRGNAGKGWFGTSAPKRLLSLGAVPAAKHPTVLRAAQDALRLYSQPAPIKASRGETPTSQPSS